MTQGLLVQCYRLGLDPLTLVRSVQCFQRGLEPLMPVRSGQCFLAARES